MNSRIASMTLRKILNFGRDQLRLGFWLLTIHFCSGYAWLNAQTVNPLEGKEGFQNPAPINDTLPVPKDLELVSSLLESQLRKDNQSVGRVDDVAFDLETEHLALFVASSGVSEESRRYALIPFVSGDRLIQFDWEKKLTLQSKPLLASRNQASEVYRDYKEVIYWIDFAKKKLSESTGTFNDQDFPLAFFSTIGNFLIADKTGEAVGKVHDVAIKASNGEILYIVVLSRKDEYRAIPLGAFVSDEKPEQWHIDLEAEQIFKFKTFDPKTPPLRVDRGWEEYISTKYGRGGLQGISRVK